MEKKKRALLFGSVCLGLMIMFMQAAPALAADVAEAAEEYKPPLHSTIWALLPPVIAISLALITKEVYSSLFVGILAGAMMYSNFSFVGTVEAVFSGGIISVLSDSYNVGIIVFLVILGAMVALMNKAGGSKAFGQWASTHIKSKVGAQLATVLLGVLIFIDDYFNCLTVGSVMRSVTDKNKVSRAKLAYVIDATAAPVCIIAPISSWAAAVSGFVEGEDGIALFIKAIPYNFYALLTIIMMVLMIILKVEFGPMKRHEMNAAKGDLYTTSSRPYAGIENEELPDSKGTVLDLVIPIISLVVCCVIGMIYTGGFFDGADFVTAFSNSDASVGLVLGSFFGFLITIILYMIRRVLKFNDCMSCLVDGFKAMVPAILILTLAWSLKGMTDMLGAKQYVEGVMKAVSGDLASFLPAIIFLVACFLAFATGTSWGTFGILIPIVVGAFASIDYELMVISISACMAGAVCGDHCSPISDTTIMASAGAQCDHVNHVSTQLPYAVVAAAVSFVGYLVAGLIKMITFRAKVELPFANAWISLPIAIVLMVGVVFVIKALQKDKVAE